MFDDKHTSEILSDAMDGDVESIKELVRRQQNGTAFRLYPRGRDGPEDEGVCPVVLSLEETFVTVKSGRPSETILFNKHQTQQWVLGMAELFAYLIKFYHDEGLSDAAIEMAIDSQATPEFGCTVKPMFDEQMVACEFTPPGETSWRVSIDGAHEFIQQSLIASAALGWEMEATDEEINTLRPFLEGAVELDE